MQFPGQGVFHRRRCSDQRYSQRRSGRDLGCSRKGTEKPTAELTTPVVKPSPLKERGAPVNLNDPLFAKAEWIQEIGRASCRERV